MLNDELPGRWRSRSARAATDGCARLDAARDFAGPITICCELPIRSADGQVFPLKRVAQVKTIIGQPEIDREDLKRMVAVTGRIEGRDLGSTVDEVKQILDQPGLFPPGITYELGGDYEQQQIAFRGQRAVTLGAPYFWYFCCCCFSTNVSALPSRCWRFRFWRWLPSSSGWSHPHGNERHLHHGNDDDRRHRDGSGDFLLLGIRRIARLTMATHTPGEIASSPPANTACAPSP